MTFLFLIVARGGSKRLPEKNLREIQGISLVGYKCLAAKHSKYCTDVIISTDHPLIADEARKYGVTVPFIRPDELSTDTATTEDVVRHAIAWFEERGNIYDAIHLLEPSSPFVRPEDYDSACESMTNHEMQFIWGDVLYLFRWNYLKTRVDLYDNPIANAFYSMPDEYSIDIDLLEDLEYAQQLAKKGAVDLSWATP